MPAVWGRGGRPKNAGKDRGYVWIAGFKDIGKETIEDGSLVGVENLVVSLSWAP